MPPSAESTDVTEDDESRDEKTDDESLVFGVPTNLAEERRVLAASWRQMSSKSSSSRRTGRSMGVAVDMVCGERAWTQRKDGI